MKGIIEEKELSIISLKHEIKLEKDSNEHLSQSRIADSNKTINEAIQKVKDIESINQALNADNDRLINRIKELERENISLKTDIATHDALKRTDMDNLTFKLQNSLQQKELKIQDLSTNVDELDNSNQRLVHQLERMQSTMAENEQNMNDKISKIINEKDQIIKDLKIKVAQLEDENKQANEKVMRNLNFRQSVFAFEANERVSPQPNPVSKEDMIQDTYFNIAMKQNTPNKLISSQEMNGISTFAREEDSKVPGGSKDNPIELQPVRISSANSHHSFELGPPSPAFSKMSSDPHISHRNNEETNEDNAQKLPNMQMPSPYSYAPIPGVSMMMNMNQNRTQQVNQSQNFLHNGIQTEQNERNFQPPVSMSQENLPEYNYMQRMNQ